MLLAAGAAMVVLGLEGWEMAEQVLPGAVFRRVEAAARGLLQRPYAGVDDRWVCCVTRRTERCQVR